MKDLGDFLTGHIEYFIDMFAMSVPKLLFGRVFCAAIATSVMIALVMAARKWISPRLRSWCWGACFIGLLLPYKHSLVRFLSSSLIRGYKSIAIIIEEMSAKTNTNLHLLGGFSLFGIYCLWMLGSVFFFAKTYRDYRKTRLMIRRGELPLCAAYFHKWRSHIYLPPNFETTFTPTEQELMLAHERQHVIQHDPLLYQLLMVVECVFWFCPPVYKAARLFKRDRELLCDERVTKNRSKLDYGLMLIKAAEKKMAVKGVIGVVSEFGLTERIEACIEPTISNTKISAAIIVAVALLLLLSFPGFSLSPVSIPVDADYSLPLSVLVYIDDEHSAYNAAGYANIAELERFVQIREDGVFLDQPGMHECALSLGMQPDTNLSVMFTWYPVAGDAMMKGVSMDFTVGDLLGDTLFVPLNTPFERFADWIFRVL